MNVRRKIKAAMSLSAATLALLQSNGEAKTKDFPVEKPSTMTSSSNLVSQLGKLILTPGDTRSDIETVGRGGGHSSHSSHSSHYSGSPAHSSHYSTSPAHYSGSSSSYSYSPPPVTRPSVAQPVYPAAAPASASPEGVEAKAVEILKEQADSGNASAQYALAIRYLNGKGVEKSAEKAILLLKSAAAAGNNSAKIKLKELLVDVAVNPEGSTNAVAGTNLVITTYLVTAEEAAHETEDAKMLYERAMKFLTGTEGESQDIERAKLYLKMAADDGSKRATNVLKQLNEKIK